MRPEEEFRLAVVIDYCFKNDITLGFDCNIEEYERNERLFRGKDLEAFIKIYIWIFLQQRTPDKEEIEQCKKNAIGWVARLQKIHREFNNNYGCYIDNVFKPILDSANLIKRIEKLNLINDMSIKDKSSRLKRIQELFGTIISKYVAQNNKMISDSDFIIHKTKYQRFFFDLDLLTIQTFQKQKSLYDLKKCNLEMIQIYNNIYRESERNTEYIRRDNCTEKKESPNTTVTSNPNEESSFKLPKENEIIVYSWEELQHYLTYCRNMFEKQIKEQIGKSPIYSQIWYRGQTTENYSLCPTAYRAFKDNSDIRKVYKTFCGYQRSMFEYFKTLADGAPEIPFYGDFSQADYVALMQHYGLNTNLLDFSENAFIALYLALKYYSAEEAMDAKKYMVEEGCLDKFIKKKQGNVVLYLFSPALYNKWRADTIKAKIEENVLSADEQKTMAQVYGLEATYDLHGFIPNVSSLHSETLFSRYIFGNDCLDEVNSICDADGNTIPALPIALWTPRLNHRIRTQSGSFVAFDLYEDIENCDNSLESIQNAELSTPGKKNPCIFLYRIVIDKEACQSICDVLNTMGMTRQFVYPEIDQVKYRFN